ncbi:hypothetical protein As57867_002551, partial [Aphanomyces stellatus]
MATAKRTARGKCHRHVYPISLKQKALAMTSTMSIRKVGIVLSIPYPTIRNWVKVAKKLHDYKGNKKNTNLPGAGRPTIIPEPEKLLAFMNDRRHQERALTCTHMVNFLKQHKQPWLQLYIARQKEGCVYDHLLRLLQEFCAQHGYTHQQASMFKRVITDLESTRAEFAAQFFNQQGDVPDDCVYNADETAIRHATKVHLVPSRRKSKDFKGREALLPDDCCTDDPTRWPQAATPIRHQRSTWRRIDTKELPSFPSGHYYAVQNKAWMDSSVWQQYLWFVLAEGVQGKSVLVLDNFESHVSDEGKETAALLEYDVCALPPNATSHCQPFDVSIMAPFKRHMRDLWIAEDMIS